MPSRYPVDPITLRIDGVDWTYWKTMEITRQMDAIAGAFTIGLADKWVNGTQALPIAPGMPCEVLIGSDPVINGYIDKVTPSFSATAHGISITGRDKSADLVDCSAVHRPGQWLNQNALQLATILAAPFGVPVRAEGDVGAPFPTFKLEQGETAFEALDRALKLRELLACPDGKGGLVLLKVGAWQNSAVVKQGENILNGNGTFDMTDRYSDYIVQGQQPGTDDVYGLEACAVASTTKDPAVKRYRPLIVRAEGNVDGGGAAQRAAWEKTVRAARAVTISSTQQGFRQGEVGSGSGPLWQINAMTQVDIPYLRISQELVASKVTFKRDASGGSTTVLELKDPASFKPEPKKQKGKGGADKAYTIEKEKDLQTQAANNAAAGHAAIKDGK